MIITQFKFLSLYYYDFTFFFYYYYQSFLFCLLTKVDILEVIPVLFKIIANTVMLTFLNIRQQLQ